MKKRFLTVSALLLCAALLLSCTSCGMLQNMQKYARLAKMLEPLDNPEATQLAEMYNEALAAALREATELKEHVSFSVGKPSVSSETGDVGILSKAADTLKKMIMQSGPGSEDRTLQPRDSSGTLLKDLSAADISSVSGVGVQTKGNETNPDGTEVTDADGNPVYRVISVDNVVRMEFCFYDEEKKTETDENGNEKETVTLLPVNAAVIEKYFGAPEAKADVLAGFNGVKDYLQVNDYTVEYKECRIKTVAELETGLMDSVTFEKKMTVTAQVTGVGEFAHMGEFTVTFDANENTEYTFVFPEKAE